MSTPIRIQLSRKKGWRMPPNDVKVDRTSKWGNRYKVGAQRKTVNDDIVTVRDQAHAVELHRAWAKRWYARWPRDLEPLRGKNLACWCHLCQAHAAGKPLGVECPDCAPCHADVLLEIANA